MGWPGLGWDVEVPVVPVLGEGTGLGNDGWVVGRGVDVACCKGVQALGVEDGVESWERGVLENGPAHVRPVFGELRESDGVCEAVGDFDCYCSATAYESRELDDHIWGVFFV